jgi:hypothetical protein
VLDQCGPFYALSYGDHRRRLLAKRVLGCLGVLIPRTRESASVIRRARTSTNVAEGDHEAGVGQHLAEHVALGARDAAPSQRRF